MCLRLMEFTGKMSHWQGEKGAGKRSLTRYVSTSAFFLAWEWFGTNSMFFTGCSPWAEQSQKYINIKWYYTGLMPPESDKNLICCRTLVHNHWLTPRYFELVAFAVNGKVAEEVFYLTDTVNMLQVMIIIVTLMTIMMLTMNMMAVMRMVMV